jgi:hypothetical protein
MRGRPVDAFLFSPAEAERERREKLRAQRRTPLSCGNRPGSNRKEKPKRQPHDHYTVESYGHAISHACNQAYPPSPELARQKVEGRRGLRWERETEWKARLGPEAWGQLEAWQKAHHWSPHRLRKNAGTEIRRQFGVEMSTTILGHQSIAVNELYSERDHAKAEKIIGAIG